jgi:hypothetical protein
VVRDADKAATKAATDAAKAAAKAEKESEKAAAAATELLSAPLASLQKLLSGIPQEDVYMSQSCDLLVGKAKNMLHDALKSVTDQVAVEYDVAAVRDTQADLLTKVRTPAY